MATRRKYKVPAFKDGGAVPSGAVIPDSVGHAVLGKEHPIEAAPIEAQLAAEPVAAAPSPPADDGADALVHAARASARAEELQRNAARQPRTVEQHIDGLALSDHKKQFLKQHPKMATDPEEARAMSFAYQAALARNVPDDSEAMNQAILAHMYREVEFKEKAPPAEAAPRAPIAAPRRSSLPLSAPPSRSVPSYASGKPASSIKMTLSAEERDIAHKSIINRPDMPPLSDAQKEYVYLQNRNRYRSMLADGSYSEQGNGGSPPLRAGYRDD